MQREKWFDKKFSFDLDKNDFNKIVERLKTTHNKISELIYYLESESLKIKSKDSWSIQENIGHLYDLEELWLGRVDDILDELEVMRPADLENLKTHHANQQ